MRPLRTGGVYIAVLGTSLLAALLGITALLAQRIQNRMLNTAGDISQAQLNAHTAAELSLLTIKQSSNWRTSQSNGNWFTNRTTDSGKCTGIVTDPIDDNLADDADEAVTIRGIGYSGQADQRFEATFDAIRQPHDCLKSGGTAAPDWSKIVQHYQSVGTAIDINALGPPQLARNGDLSSTTLSPYWTGIVAGMADDAEIDRMDLFGAQYIRVHTRDDKQAGVAQIIGPLLKGNTTYDASIQVYFPSIASSDQFRISFHANPAVNGSPVTHGSWETSQAMSNGWVTHTVQFTTPNWTESQLANAIVFVDSKTTSNVFYVDNLSVQEVTTDKYIYRKVLSAGVNPFGSVNTSGIYYIDCGGSNTLVIERSRIIGTLLVLNPGSNSRIGNGPIHWTPHLPGYPILLVNGSFGIQSPNVALVESTNAVNFNPTGAPAFSLTPTTDSVNDDTYPAAEAMRGLIGVSGNLTYQNSPQITGRVFVGGSTTGTPTFTYRPDSLLSPPPPLGGFYTYRYDRRPNSTRKVVLP